MADRPTAADPETAQADRWARREPLLRLLSRACRGVLLPQEGPLLRAQADVELADAEAAHADVTRLSRELETMTHVAKVNGESHRAAYQGGEEARAAVARARHLATVWLDAPDPLVRAGAHDLISALDGAQQPGPDGERELRPCGQPTCLPNGAHRYMLGGRIHHCPGANTSPDTTDRNTTGRTTP